jgi:hypothetical protein
MDETDAHVFTFSDGKVTCRCTSWRPGLGDDPKTVPSTYAHLLPQSDELAAERVAQALA